MIYNDSGISYCDEWFDRPMNALDIAYNHLRQSFIDYFVTRELFVAIINRVTMDQHVPNEINRGREIYMEPCSTF